MTGFSRILDGPQVASWRVRYAAQRAGSIKRIARSFGLALMLSLVGAVSAAGPDVTTVKLRLAPRFILQSVAQCLGIDLRREVPLPTIFLESAIQLHRLQVAIEGQWGFRPHVFVNAYVYDRNEIYLIDRAAHYVQHNRTLEDSLAHEFVHYLQAKYRNEDLALEWREIEAVAIQKAFREACMYEGGTRTGTAVPANHSGQHCRAQACCAGWRVCDPSRGVADDSDY